MEFMQTVITVAAGIIASGIVGIAIYHYKKKADCFTVLKNTAYRTVEDVNLIKKFLAIQSRLLDASTRSNHPKDTLRLEELAKQMFTEE